MKKHSIAIATGVLLVGLCGAAWAMEGGPGGGREHDRMMEEADANHDGKVSYDEFKAAHEKRMQEHFKKMDANGDGFVDKAEAQKAREMMREKMKEHMEMRKEMRDKMKEGKPQ